MHALWTTILQAFACGGSTGPTASVDLTQANRRRQPACRAWGSKIPRTSPDGMRGNHLQNTTCHTRKCKFPSF
uniref:Secreted protein n=1 Tax=Chelonoidis abingdonii TaxID=106734 RepID=A0A8C0FY74_CHEAB